MKKSLYPDKVGSYLSQNVNEFCLGVGFEALKLYFNLYFKTKFPGKPTTSISIIISNATKNFILELKGRFHYIFLI